MTKFGGSSTPTSTRSAGSRSSRGAWSSIQNFMPQAWRNNSSSGQNMEHDVDMTSPGAGVVPGGVCKKEYMKGMLTVVKDIVESRRHYLNNADENWQNFLDNVECCYKFFVGKDPSRMYREDFQIENYRMLFQRESSAFRDDVCRGVKRIRDGMWVNGEEVHFPSALQEMGFDLADRGESLMNVAYELEEKGLHRPTAIASAVLTSQQHDAIKKFKVTMQRFDSKYCEFEKAYIEALIQVEKRSRGLIANLAEKIVENKKKDNKEVDQSLLDDIAELNKKSRDCCNVRYELKVFQACINGEYEAKIHRKLWYLPKDVVETFNEICSYLTDLLPKILRVHPKLEHNPGLVARLEKFHEAYKRVDGWLRGSCDSDVKAPISAFCEYLDKALGTDSANDLEADVEHILQIPRLFCLFTWENRVEIQENPSSNIAVFVNELYPDLLLEVARVFSALQDAEMGDDERLRQVVECGMSSDTPSEIARAAEVLSMSLQRKNANAWNAFVSVILHSEDDEEEQMMRPRLPSV